MVYSFIQNFRRTKPSITCETREVSHRKISCAARVCWTAEKVLEKAGPSPAFTVQAFAHPHAQTLSSLSQTGKLCLVQWQMTKRTPHVPVQSSVLPWFSFSDVLFLLCICIIRKLCGHTKEKGRRGRVAREGTQLVRISTWVAHPKPQIGSSCPLCLFHVCLKSIIVGCFSNKWKNIQHLIILLLSFHNTLLIFSNGIEAATEDRIFPFIQVYVRSNCSEMIFVSMLGNLREKLDA